MWPATLRSVLFGLRDVSWSKEVRLEESGARGLESTAREQVIMAACWSEICVKRQRVMLSGMSHMMDRWFVRKERASIRSGCLILIKTWCLCTVNSWSMF